MSNTYSIVTAARHHVRAMPAIEQAAASLFADVDLPPGIRFRVTDPKTLGEAQENGRMWVALQPDGSPVGFAYAVILGDEAHLDEMNVHPDHGRRGIGSALLRTVIDWGRSSGYPGLTLVTFRHLRWNAPFYANLGFEEISQDATSDAIRLLMTEEQKAGINIANRVAMRLDLE